MNLIAILTIGVFVAAILAERRYGPGGLAALLMIIGLLLGTQI